MNERTPQPSGGSTGAPAPAPRLMVALLILSGVLVTLFWRSSQPGQALFANDAPLGWKQAYAAWAASHFFGTWLDLNWIGIEAPSAPLDLSSALFLVLGGTRDAVVFNNLYAPASLLFLGLGAWFFCRQLGFAPAVCVLTGLAAALNSDALSYACWGLPTLTLGLGFFCFALGLLAAPRDHRSWIRLCLAGLAVGLCVMESYDSGAILSLYVAAFVVYRGWFDGVGSAPARLGRGALQVALVAVCAALISMQTIGTLIATQIKGVAGMAQDAQTRERRWMVATQWSLPKQETLRLIIPGLFGYRMDTPGGGNYWGAVGRDAAWEAYLAQPNPDPARQPHPIGLRHSGAGFYAGVLVVLIAVWAVFQSLRRKDSRFEPQERRVVLFWACAAVISLLLAFGRYAPFYQFFYALPYFSTIRMPIKFLHPLNLCLVILFGYGLNALWRRHVRVTPPRLQPVIVHLHDWWKSAPAPDRRWTVGMIGVFGAGLLAWLFYASSNTALVRYLGRVGFGPSPARLAESIARFSIGEVGWFVLFLTLSIGLMVLILSGALSGRRAAWAGLLTGLLLVGDLVRANVPWVVYYDYEEKYAANPVLELLRRKPHEYRVTSELAPLTRKYMMYDRLYDEWLQRLFPYYRIRSLDIIQMARTPELDDAYLGAFLRPTSNSLARIGRLWQLTNTRLVLGPAQAADFYNQQYDPLHKRFRALTNFHVLTKPNFPRGISLDETPVEKLTASLDPAGQFALFEFTGALPRAKLFTRWQVSTNDQEVLARLADPLFDPNEELLVGTELVASESTTTNATAGPVELELSEPKHVRLRTQSETAAVLLLNDRYHPSWKVSVDGKPEALLRCNFIMRGVQVPPGSHTVEFRFEPPVRAFYLSLTAVLAGLVLCGVLIFAHRREREAGQKTEPVTEPRPGKKEKRP